MSAVPEHLGGYVPGGDEATQFPDLWRALVEAHRVSSVIDVGCGDGQAVDFFAGEGCYVLGIDGVPQDDDRIITHDFTHDELTLDRMPVGAWSSGGFDLAWCCEFVEHVEERYLPNFLATFETVRPGGLLLMTHADPGQGGHHHVNCQTADYWRGALAAAGFEYEYATTVWAKTLAARNPSPWNHFLRSGHAFRRL